MATQTITKVDIAPENWDCIIAPTSALVIITTTDAAGNVNAAAFGSTVRVCHDPVQLAFTCTQGSDTHANILETGEFVVNLVPFDEEILKKVLVVGLPWRKGINELEMADLTPIPSKVVHPPRIAECYAHFEMKVEWTHSWIHRMTVTGNAVAVSTNPEAIDENEMIAFDRAKPSHYAGGRYQDQFVAIPVPTRVSWDWRALEAKGVTADYFRRPSDGVEDPVLTPVEDWRDMMRSVPRS